MNTRSPPTKSNHDTILEPENRSLPTKQRYRNWSCFFALLAMFSLIWWQFRMIETGSSLDFGKIRWIFSAPFYSFIVTTSISGGLLFASYYTHRVSRYFQLVVYGLALPACLFWSNYRYFDFEGWIAYSRWDFLSVVFTQNIFLLVLAGATLNFAYHTIIHLLPPEIDRDGQCDKHPALPEAVQPSSESQSQVNGTPLTIHVK